MSNSVERDPGVTFANAAPLMMSTRRGRSTTRRTTFGALMRYWLYVTG